MRLTALLLAKQITKSALLATEKELVVKAPWGNLTALTWGDSTNPPIFLCHGRLDSCSSFRPLVNLLPEDNFYVSLDLPGNGRSDYLPRGARVIIFDFIPSLVAIKKHFKWKKFVYIGHSLGAAIGKYYNMVYPSHMSRIVELDPEPAYLPPYGTDIRNWYLHSYDTHYSNYEKYLGSEESAPRYTYEEVKAKLMKARGIGEEAAEHVLERCLVPTGDGKFRISYDQRMKITTVLPLSNLYQDLYTASSTPTLAIFATETVERGIYKKYPFAMDESAWPNRNYQHAVVPGGHDVHLQQTSLVAQHVKQFMKQ